MAEDIVSELREELEENILPYWLRLIDSGNGGFYGRVTGDEQLDELADKGLVLNARILWTFSAAYRLLGREEYLQAAVRAKDYLLTCFRDKQYGGFYWSVDAYGNPLDTKKQTYAQGFVIYGLSEFYRATSDCESIEVALETFHYLEKYAYDPHDEGYIEALDMAWQPIADMRLSEKDENEKKSMNTHLHVLEPYANLYRVVKDELLGERLKMLIEVFLTKIVDAETHHLRLFFTERWESRKNIISYGHDIEAAWLLHEAALVLGDPELLRRVEKTACCLADAAAEGILPDGSLAYEMCPDSGHCDEERHWWVQAEGVVGYWNDFRSFGREDSRRKALALWSYIRENLIDRNNGEWFWSIRPDGAVNRVDDKAGFWKCPYHNSRMCLEMIKRNRVSLI